MTKGRGIIDQKEKLIHTLSGILSDKRKELKILERESNDKRYKQLDSDKKRMEIIRENILNLEHTIQVQRDYIRQNSVVRQK